MRQTPWSPKVIKARDMVNILKQLLGMYRTQVNMTKSIAKLHSKAGQQRTLPSNEIGCNAALRVAQETSGRLSNSSFLGTICNLQP
jgi:hypothetical protein